MATRFIDHLLEGDHASRPAFGSVPQGTLYACSDHALIYQSDGVAAWSTWATLGTAASGSITASGYTQNTARLLGRTTASSGAIEEMTVGSGLSLAAGTLTATAGGVASGTSNPGSPTTGDLFWRTDLSLLITFDGTRWVTADLKRETLGVSSSSAGAGTDAIMPLPTGANTSIARWTPWSTTFDLWLDAFYTSTFVNGTNNGTNFWTLTLQKASVTDAKTTIVSLNTSAHTASNWTQVRTSIAAVYTASGHRELDVQALATLSPGTLFWGLALSYRLIVP